MSVSPLLPLILALVAQAPQAGDAKDERAARLEFMKKSLANYDLHPASDRTVKFRLQADPVLRFTNPVGYSEDGAIFFWTGEDGRPEAAVQAFLMRGGTYWMHDFTSLATGPIVANSASGVAWSPSKGGVEFKPIPGAPKPAESAEARLRQMRDLAHEFAVSDDFREQGWQVLRPMPKPFARYGKPGTPLLDGSVFCFALGTDPEAYLMLEARPGKDGPEWQFAFAPQTTYALKATWKGQEVWSLPYRSPWSPTETFHGRRYRPEE
jgi:hypothetical protein